MVVEVVLKGGETAYKSSAYASEAHRFHREYMARISDLGLVGRKKQAPKSSGKGEGGQSSLSRLRLFGSGSGA